MIYTIKNLKDYETNHIEVDISPRFDTEYDEYNRPYRVVTSFVVEEIRAKDRPFPFNKLSKRHQEKLVSFIWDKVSDEENDIVKESLEYEAERRS